MGWFGGSSSSTAIVKNHIDFTPTTNVNFDIDALVEAINGTSDEAKKIELLKIKQIHENAKKEQLQNGLLISQIDSFKQLIPFSIVVFLGYQYYKKRKK